MKCRMIVGCRQGSFDATVRCLRGRDLMSPDAQAHVHPTTLVNTILEIVATCEICNSNLDLMYGENRTGLTLSE